MGKKSAGAGVRLFPSSAYSMAEEQTRNAIGRRIAALREEKGLSLAELSERLKPLGLSLDRTTIGKWEKGRSTPSAYQLIAVGRFFGIDSLDYFTSLPASDTLNTEGMEKLASYRADLIASGRYRPQALTLISWNATSDAKLGSYCWYIRATPKSENDDYSKITFIFAEEGEEGTTNITNISDSSASESYFSPNGIQLEKPMKGLNIIKMKDGSTRKVIIR